MKISDYQTLVFDCDGVVLNSNKVKTDAFYKAALPFGEEAAQKLVAHHLLNGGISRYKKFEWFIREVVNVGEAELNKLLETYAKFVRDGLLTCDIAEGLFELREKTPHANWLIVSGGDQQELREIFAARGLSELFDGGIFGSPDSKDTILVRELANKNICKSAIFIGDSRYDYESANRVEIEFIFLKKWSEFKNHKDYFNGKKVLTLNNIIELRDL